VHLLSGSSSFVLGGLSLFVLAAPAAVTVHLVRNLAPRRVMSLGVVTLIVGVGLTLLAINAGSTVGFFVGTAVAGVGFGGGFQGGLRTVLPLAAPHERAGVLSTIYIVSYLAMGLPAVVAGVIVEHVGVLTTAREYVVVVMVLAALALLALAARRRAGDVERPSGPSVAELEAERDQRLFDPVLV
jgi:MFS family permease